MQLTPGKGSKQKRCGRCYGCKAKDCGVCRHCLDKKKFGGPNRLKQCCIHKKCAEYKDTAPKRPPDAGTAQHLIIRTCIYVYSIEPFLNYPGVCTDDRKITTEAFVRVSWHNVGKLGVPIHLLLSRHFVHCIHIIVD